MVFHMQRQCVVIYFDECIYVVFHEFDVFRCVLASLYEGVSVRLSVCLSVGPSVTCFFFQTPKMSCFLYENHRGSPTLILLNVLGVLGVLGVLNVLHVLHVLNVLHVLHVLHGRIVGLLGLVYT